MSASREFHGEGAGGDHVKFLYTGQDKSDISRDVTHVRVDPSVKKIAERAFGHCEQLEELELCDGLEKIGEYAFYNCKNLKRVRIPPTVKKIAERVFWFCEQLEEVELCDGLVEIGQCAFAECESLKRVRIPPTVKKIGGFAFKHLEEVELCKGLENIGGWAFYSCKYLRCVRIPPTVRKIGGSAFQYCGKLEELQLCEGVEEIGEGAFHGCKLKRVRIPSTVQNIDKHAFSGCTQLEEVELFEGLKNIGDEAFAGCKSLRHIAFPSTLRFLREGTFEDCDKLQKVDLREGLVQIAQLAFINCRSLQHIRIPSTVKIVGKWAFSHCVRLVSVELNNGLEEIGKLAFENCFSLRNISVPSTVKNIGYDALRGCHDIRKLLGTQNERADALKCRFHGLPIHQLCYDQSCCPFEEIFEQLQDIFSMMSDQVRASIPAESSLDQMKGNGKRQATWSESGPKTKVRCQGTANSDAAVESAGASATSYSTLNMYNMMDCSQDCLGMTPLHILACSIKQNLALYQLITASQPKCLITKDRWGCLPVVYAIWGSCSPEIVQFLIDSQESAFPDIDLNWDMMVSTLCRVAAPLDVIQKVLEINQSSFSKQNINLQRAARELIIHCLVGCRFYDKDFPSSWGSMIKAVGNSQAHQEIIQSMLETHQLFFTDRSTTSNWQAPCEEFAKPLKGWWQPQSTFLSFSVFRFLTRCSIPDRLYAIGVRKWQIDIEYLLGKVPLDRASPCSYLDSIHSKLVFYEREYNQMKDTMFLLELALWKSKIDCSNAIKQITQCSREKLGGPPSHTKTQCRLNCGAEIIIPNVLPYLIADPEQENLGFWDGDTSENTSSEEDTFEGYSDWSRNSSNQSEGHTFEGASDGSRSWSDGSDDYV